ERGATVVQVGAGTEMATRAPGAFQRRNFATARVAAEAFLKRPLDRGLAAQVAATVTVPGRLELIAEGPPIYLDAAHNPAGAAALAESLPAVAAGQRVVACLAIIADKDAAAMIAALAPALDRVVCTELPAAALEGHGRPGARSHPAAELAALCERVGLRAEAEPRLEAALERARSLALGPPEGVLLIAGSHYAIAPARAFLAA
ncbi:MAG TPA: cyanophycin synthetase, partial [Solirubrobacterales bacterium]|nr:cyanophycin synthetase [Solirubrobacterales bacterium]